MELYAIVPDKLRPRTEFGELGLAELHREYRQSLAIRERPTIYSTRGAEERQQWKAGVEEPHPTPSRSMGRIRALG